MALYLGNQKVSLRSGQDPTFDYGFDSNGRLVFANKNATEINNFLNYDSSYSEILDLSNLSKMEKVAVNGTVDRKMEGLKGLLVSPNAPFTGSSPQINASYTGLSKSALVSLFESVPYNVGYTKVGNPTIVDGVASGFSSNSYLKISPTYNATNKKNVEIYIRAKTPSTLSSGFNTIISGDGKETHFGISVYSNALFAIRMGYQSGTVLKFDDMFITGGVKTSTWYRFNITGKNGIWRAEAYDDNSNLLAYSDKDWSEKTINANFSIYLQCMDTTGTHSGEIDLKTSYIKVNGVPWFGPGVTKNLVPDGTVVGDVTVKDGVASGFSENDYLKINTTSIVPDLLEFAGKFTMGPNGEGGYIFNNFSVPNGISLTVRPTSSPNQGMLLYAGTSHYVFYTKRFEAGTTHTYKVLYNKSSGICELYVNDVLVRTLNTSEYTVNFGGTIYIGCYGTDGFGGSIDLNNTYIKVGSDYFYRGMVPMTKTCSVVGCAGTADLTQENKNIILNKGWSLTVQ